ncbi:TPA: hypothetical protein GXZ34_00175 [bacterium]|jgi:tetrahydromethanopterin S-methyltransferase subunit E|nr:hypothetical protein [bacterium]
MIVAKILFTGLLVALTVFYVIYAVKGEKTNRNWTEVGVWATIFIVEIAELQLDKLFGVNMWQYALALVALTFAISKLIMFIPKKEKNEFNDPELD